MDDRVTVAARVTGRVQGVWFRAWTVEQARALGLDGWVRNEPDGAVRVLISGPAAAVGRLVKALEQGPPAARVVKVETEASAESVEAGFRVVR